MALSVAYLLLAVRQNIWCWAAAFVSTAIYTVVFYEAHLYMDSALQVFYLLMAVYGWTQWRHHDGSVPDLTISMRPAHWHVIVILSVLAASMISGRLLDAYTEAAFPYLDSLTTWASVVTTWMVARKVLENWLYWIAVDSLSVYLYISRSLYLTVLLFVLYVLIAIAGWRQWRRAFLDNGHARMSRSEPKTESETGR